MYIKVCKLLQSSKAELSMPITESGMFTVTSDEQLANAANPMDWSPFIMCTEVKLVQFLNANTGIVSILGGIKISVNEQQDSKQFGASVSKLSGKFIEIKFVQWLKAWSSIWVIVSGKLIDTSSVHPKKASQPIRVMPSGTDACLPFPIYLITFCSWTL